MFADREQAAREMAERLMHYRGQSPLVLAVPRGGVPMGRILADALEGDLDVVLVHKLGAPGNAEFAIGSVDEEGRVTVSEVARHYGIAQDYIDREAERQLAALRRRRERYGRPPADVRGRIAVVVDDGIATGATLVAALQAVRAQRPKRLVAAVAVAPPETAVRLEREADELVCLQTPEDFVAVGQFFRDFSQVSDEQVVATLGGRDERG